MTVLRNFQSPFRFVGQALEAFPILGFVAACGANHNFDERYDYAEANGLLPAEGCIATCRETPPARRVDCEGPVEGYDFFPAIDISASQATVYLYDDQTTSSGEASVGYRPPPVVMSRCRGEAEDNHVLELRGGPYISYGGGAGRALHQEEIAASADLPFSTEFGIWARDLSQWEGVSFWARRGVESQSGIRVGIADKHIDDDLAYIDYYTRELDMPESEIYPRAERVYCRRARECDCPLGKPCTFYEGTRDGDPNRGYYCWDPEVDLEPMSDKPPAGEPVPPGTRFSRSSQGAEYVNHDRCGQTACDRFYPAYEGKTQFQPTDPEYCPPSTSCENGRPPLVGGFDPEFYGRACSTHTFSNGATGDYCFDPGRDPPPPEAEEKCGDIWYSPVLLTTEWEFYTVPFNEMLQYGFAKESFELDLENVSTLRFTWDRGWAEYWLDDVNFYRRRSD